MLGLIIISSLANIFYSHFEDVNHKKEIAEKDARIEELLKETKGIKETTKDNNTELKNISKILENYGVENPKSLNIAQAEEILLANKIREETIAYSKNKSSRGAILIKYFPKDVDGQKVYSALEELDFNVSEGTPIYHNKATNALYYGSNVDMESIKLIVLTLLRAGVKIEGLLKYKNNNGKENLIQVVHSGNVTKSTKLEVENLIGIEFK